MLEGGTAAAGIMAIGGGWGWLALALAEEVDEAVVFVA